MVSIWEKKKNWLLNEEMKSFKQAKFIKTNHSFNVRNWFINSCWLVEFPNVVIKECKEISNI